MAANKSKLRRMSRFEYVGRRDNRKPCVFVIGPTGEAALDPRTDLRSHSAAGFEWGYSGSGPAQLALAMLAHCVGDEDALAYYQKFKFRYVASFASDGWSMTDAEVRAALRAIREERSF